MKIFLTILLRNFAARAIPYIEAKAIEYYLTHGTDLTGKAEQAKEYMRDLYTEYSDRVPVLKATKLDDALIEEALDEMWGRIDERIKQAARDAKASLPTPPVTDAVTYTPAPAPGKPTTDADFGPSLADQFPQG